MPAKKSKSSKPGKKTAAKAKTAKAAKPKAKPVSKTKPAAKAKPAGKSKKASAKVKKSPPAKTKITVKKPVATKKAAKKPEPKKAAAPPAKAAKKNDKAVAVPAKTAVAVKAPDGKKVKEPPPRGVVPLTKMLKFEPLKPTPRTKVEEVGATIEIAKGPVKMTPFLKKQKQRLIDLRDSLLNTIEGVSQESLRQRAEGSEASAFGMHQADAGSDAYDRDFALSLLSQEQDALYEINEALKRINSGTYGICEMSGKRIPEPRLEALPFTRFTVECQSRIEQNQMGGRWRRPVRSLFGLDDAAAEDDDSGDEEESSTTSKSNASNESLDFAKE